MNEIVISDNHASVIIISPKFGEFKVKIDLEDVEKCSQVRWCISRRGRVGQKNTFYASNTEMGLMHRFIMDAPKGMDVDHIHGDTIDNRKNHLRICERIQNSRNSKHYSNNTSGHKGVSWHEQSGKWIVSIRINWKHKTLGYFLTLEEAVKVREEAEIKYFGEYRRINYN